LAGCALREPAMAPTRCRTVLAFYITFLLCAMPSQQLAVKHASPDSDTDDGAGKWEVPCTAPRAQPSHLLLLSTKDTQCPMPNLPRLLTPTLARAQRLTVPSAWYVACWRLTDLFTWEACWGLEVFLPGKIT